ncbi:MAG: tetratricopeptide repeat protein [Zavarzinella sp.]
MTRSWTIAFVAVYWAILAHTAVGDDISTQLRSAQEQLKLGQFKIAQDHVDAALKLDDKNAQIHFMQGEIFAAMRKHDPAISAYEKAYQLDNKMIIAVDRRGGEQFKLGKVAESIVDFDRYLKVFPKQEAAHWRRGISYYYVKKFAEGARQFDIGQEVFGADVENAFWYWLCLCGKDGVQKANSKILKLSAPDARIPMMDIYAMLQGKAKPEDVIVTATNAKLSADDKNEAMFYANLYVGLYYEGIGKPKESLKHIETAVEKYVISHYMWDVAKVHHLLRTGKKD